MAIMQAFRETALPGTLAPYAIYYVAPASTPGYVEIYVTNADGSAARRIHTDTDLDNKISAALSNIGEGTAVVADIAARDLLTPSTGSTAYVIDASADATVDSGGATYIYAGSAWVKISEAESLDLVLDWSDVANRPSSSAADIDSAVTQRHTHANKTQLDKIGEDGDGNLTYGGNLPVIAWGSVGW